jgi:hypothetical protein
MIVVKGRALLVSRRAKHTESVPHSNSFLSWAKYSRSRGQKDPLQSSSNGRQETPTCAMVRREIKYVSGI